jgi:outer membrane protein
MKIASKYFLKNYRLMAMLLIAAAVMQSSFAQTPQEGWDLKACIEYAIKNNINLNTLRLTASSGEQNLLLSKSAKYPNLSGVISTDAAYYNKDLSSGSSFGLGSSVTLYNGNYYNNDIKSNNLSWHAANLDVAAAENDITLRITQAYLNILLARENIEYVKDLVATSDSQVAQCMEKYKTGSVALKDLMQLQAALANDKYTLVVAENTKRQNILDLKILLQIPTDTVFDIATPKNENTALSISALETVQKSALQSMPQIRSSDLLITKQSVELAKSKSGYLPSLSLSGSITTTYSTNSRTSYFDQLENQYNPQAGLTLSIPVFSRKTNKINMAKSKILLEQAKLASDNTKTELMQTVEQAYINVRNAQNQFIASGEQLNYAKESYRISTEQLKIGANNNVEYLQQKNLYVQALQQYVQAKYSMMLYAKIYNFYNGVPVTD